MTRQIERTMKQANGRIGLRRSTRMLLSALALVLPFLAIVGIAHADTATASLWNDGSPNLVLLAALFMAFAAMAGFVTLMFQDVIKTHGKDRDE